MSAGRSPTRSSRPPQMPHPKKLSGVCVGGPRKGHHITTLYADTFIAPVPRVLSTTADQGGPAKDEPARFVRYRYRALRPDFGIWAPVDVPTTDALRTLVNGYLSRG